MARKKYLRKRINEMTRNTEFNTQYIIPNIDCKIVFGEINNIERENKIMNITDIKFRETFMTEYTDEIAEGDIYKGDDILKNIITGYDDRKCILIWDQNGIPAGKYLENYYSIDASGYYMLVHFNSNSIRAIRMYLNFEINTTIQPRKKFTIKKKTTKKKVSNTNKKDVTLKMTEIEEKEKKTIVNFKRKKKRPYTKIFNKDNSYVLNDEKIDTFNDKFYRIINIKDNTKFKILIKVNENDQNYKYSLWVNNYPTRIKFNTIEDLYKYTGLINYTSKGYEFIRIYIHDERTHYAYSSVKSIKNTLDCIEGLRNFPASYTNKVNLL